MTIQVCEAQAKQLLENNLKEATTLIEDEAMMRKFLKGVELKFKIVPIVKEDRYLAQIPDLVTMVYDYMAKAYTQISEESIQTAVAGLMYFLSPDDLIDDNVPELGYIDDIAVLSYCVKVVEKDLNAYRSYTQRT